MEDGVNVSSITDLENYINNLKMSGNNGELAGRLTGFLDPRTKAIEEFRQNSEILGRSDDEVDSIIDIATQRGGNAYNAMVAYINKMTGGKYTALTPEANMSIMTNGN
jgi:hypothetical protein